MSTSVVHLSHKNPMGGVCGRVKVFPRFPWLWGVWGRSVVFESCLLVGSQKWIESMLLTDCKLKMHGVWWSSVFNLVLLLFVLAASCVRWYVLVVWRCWKGLSGLMAKPTSASVVSTPGKRKTVALRIHWHRCIRICPWRELWCSSLRVLGSAYLPSSLTRLRAYLRYIWHW